MLKKKIPSSNPADMVGFQRIATVFGEKVEKIINNIFLYFFLFFFKVFCLSIVL